MPATECSLSCTLCPSCYLPFVTVVPKSIATYFSCIQALSQHLSVEPNLLNQNLWRQWPENTYFHKILLVIIVYPVWSSRFPKQSRIWHEDDQLEKESDKTKKYPRGMQGKRNEILSWTMLKIKLYNKE